MNNKEQLEEFKKELRASGLHHASAEFKEKVAQKELELGIANDSNEVGEKKKVSNKWNPKKTYIFKMTRPVARWTVPREARILDKETGKYREIRYNKLATSPFVDEQDHMLPAERIAPIFNRGELVVGGDNEALLEFLINLPQYKGNSAYDEYEFYLHDVDAIMREKAELEEMVLEAKNIIMKYAKQSPSTLSDFIRGRFNYAPSDNNFDEVKLYALKKAEQYPKDFIEDITNAKYVIKSNIAKAYANRLFILDAKKDETVVKLTKGEGIIFRFDSSQRWDDALTKWVISKDSKALDFYKEVESQNL